MPLPLRKLRLRAVWLLVIPFYYFATPSTAALGVGVALGVVGLAIRAWAAGSIRKNEALATTGPYAYTRNPLYLGSFLLGLGVTIAGGQWIFMVLFLAFYLSVYRATALREEAELEEAFGEPYRTYAAAVPRFVPRFSPYRSDGARPEAKAEAGVAVHTEDGGGDFSVARYLRNREWEAGLGALAGYGLLVLKMRLLG